MKWEPIETAPVDTEILVFAPQDYDAGHSVITVATLLMNDPHPWRVEDGRDLPALWAFPTHWMPLPEPPND